MQKSPDSSFMDSETAKNHAIQKTSGHVDRERALQVLEDYRGYLAHASNEEDRQTWLTEIEELEGWLASEQFNSGNYPRGIDELVLDLIEWRAVQYAFLNVETARNPFSHLFYQQWLIGSVYAVFSLLGQLTSKDRRDNSLRKLWDEVSPFIHADGACPGEEMEHIRTRLDRESGQFTNEGSRAILFRNTVIAHNEKSLQIEWDEIDKDIETLVRLWSLIVTWSSFGVLNPFRQPNQVFAGLDGLFSSGELMQLSAKRKEYIDRAISWCQTHLHNGLGDGGRGPFATFSVTVNSVGETGTH